MSEQKLILPFMAPVYERLDKFAPLVLRLTAGLFLMPHGAQKLFGMFGGYGLDATGQYFAENLGFSNGYLAALGAGGVEFFGGLLLALGLFTRVSAGAVAVLMLVAMSVHLPAGFFWSSGGYEYPAMWTIVALYFWVKGGGELSLDRLVVGKEF